MKKFTTLFTICFVLLTLICALNLMEKTPKTISNKEVETVLGPKPGNKNELSSVNPAVAFEALSPNAKTVAFEIVSTIEESIKEDNPNRGRYIRVMHYISLTVEEGFAILDYVQCYFKEYGDTSDVINWIKGPGEYAGIIEYTIDIGFFMKANSSK